MIEIFESLRKQTPIDVRAHIRTGTYCGQTSGLANGYLQANVVILDKKFALDFMRFCQRNPKPCPLVGVTDTGSPFMRTLGAKIDIRSDVPSYNIYRDGILFETRSDITELWTDGMVGFALGCSFTFEHALVRAGIPVWHMDHDLTVPMFETNIATNPSGPFSGPMVVSMRAIDRNQLDLAKTISAKFQLAHGKPVHWGNPAAIGITDINRPDWGDPAPIGDNQIPVFWACGVTPQAAIMRANLPISITHKPGQMLITDVPEDAEVPIVTSAT